MLTYSSLQSKKQPHKGPFLRQGGQVISRKVEGVRSPTAGTVSGMQVGCAGLPKFVHKAIFFDLLVSPQRLFTLSPLMGLISCVADSWWHLLH